MHIKTKQFLLDLKKQYRFSLKVYVIFFRLDNGMLSFHASFVYRAEKYIFAHAMMIVCSRVTLLVFSESLPRTHPLYLCTIT